eukprot:CAMPEP_0197725892 /NCGR_PEP_ID=MMETSP1434-20131217/11801_1 /TAXON_ID=265543 /ORGANISM="Minutocellus polymorphus, Strain CCMP3303" /LENGTH=130 /DNA_ID=CAMNT_0043311627 /DNA_START=106 /DNA_END=498 /DNA_ORIENTATION=+
MKQFAILCVLAAGASSGVVAFTPSRPAQHQVSLSPIRSAVPYIPDGYSQKEWQAEHEAELAELQSRKEEYIGHRGAAAQPVRHLSEDIDATTHVHFHKPASSSGSSNKESKADEGETILQKMRRQWGRDD